MTELANAGLMLAEIAVYFVVMAMLFRLRRHLGIGTFFCALGVMHFLETYLASVVYIGLPLDIVVSPGSTVLFAGKVVMLLLVFIQEDAATARQPIYGLFIGNFLIVALVLLLRQHSLLSVVPGRAADFAFIDEMGWLMVWGTALLLLDGILIILLYQKLGGWLGNRVTLRIWLAASIVLTIDQAGFYLALHALLGAPISVLVGGWVVKMITAAVFAALTGAYIRFVEHRPAAHDDSGRLSEIFDVLTYRKRYRALLAERGRDGLTGLSDRRRYEEVGRDLFVRAAKAGTSLAMIVIDIDYFKDVNDRFGHAAGDGALKAIAERMTREMREADYLFRYGGEEFVVLSPGIGQPQAMLLAERLRRSVASLVLAEAGTVTISAGVAVGPKDAPDLNGLFQLADNRLYRAKAGGRDRVFGGTEPPTSAGAAPVQPALSTATVVTVAPAAAKR